MLGSAVPVTATATIHTTTSSATPTSPTRSSRLRGLSYLRNYTHNHLHSSSNSRSDAAPFTRSTSSPERNNPPASADQLPPARARGGESTTIQSGENGWLPTVQGRSGLSRDSLNPSSSTESARPEPPNNITTVMTRNRNSTSTAATAAAATPSLTSSMEAMQNRSSRRTQSQSQSQASAIDRTISSSTDALTALPEITTTSVTSASTPTPKDPLPTIRFIPHVEARTSTRPSLHFTAVSRTLKQPASIVRVGRYSERDNANANPTTTNTSSSDPTTSSIVTPVGFKSKVVSRRHCEFWCNAGQWYIKDVKSSSGTFLNHVRLSSPGAESRPYPVNDGDVVQLGIDFKGGEELIFRCVKMRVECNRGWQKGLNTFNTSAHKRLLKNNRKPTSSATAAAAAAATANNGNTPSRDSDAASTNSSECSICLNPVAPCQALFVAPCSHVWHYKCVRNLIQGPGYPNFLCPNCRFVADLEADVEVPGGFGMEGFGGDEDQEFGDLGDGGSDEDVEEDGGGEDTGATTSQDDNGAEIRERQRQQLGRGQEISEDELAGLLQRTSLQTLPTASAAAAASSRSRSSDRRQLESREDGPARAPQSLPSISASSTRPVTIASSYSSSSQQNRERTTTAEVDNEFSSLSARSATPTSNAVFALAAGVGGLQLGSGLGDRAVNGGVREDFEPAGDGGGGGPMTPRNDAGPFLLDAGSVRSARGS